MGDDRALAKRPQAAEPPGPIVGLRRLLVSERATHQHCRWKQGSARVPDIAGAFVVAVRLILALDTARCGFVGRRSLAVSLGLVAIAVRRRSRSRRRSRCSALPAVIVFVVLTPCSAARRWSWTSSSSHAVAAPGRLARSLLFTPSAMIIAQAILVAPILAALVHRAVADCWSYLRRVISPRRRGWPLRAIPQLWRSSVFGAAHRLSRRLSGRAIAEVGAIISSEAQSLGCERRPGPPGDRARDQPEVDLPWRSDSAHPALRASPSRSAPSRPPYPKRKNE